MNNKDDIDANFAKADSNKDGTLCKGETSQYLSTKQKELDDQDAMRDAQRQMAWFALLGMLLYPFAVVLATYLNLTRAAEILGDMAPTYFVSVAAIVAAFYGKEAYTTVNKK
jgi:hypothetical protein